jgi:hypothetical protein
MHGGFQRPLKVLPLLPRLPLETRGLSAGLLIPQKTIPNELSGYFEFAECCSGGASCRGIDGSAGLSLPDDLSCISIRITFL